MELVDLLKGIYNFNIAFIRDHSFYIITGMIQFSIGVIVGKMSEHKKWQRAIKEGWWYEEVKIK